MKKTNPTRIPLKHRGQNELDELVQLQRSSTSKIKPSSMPDGWTQAIKCSAWNSILRAASGDIRRLSYVNRYSSIPTLIKENTAEHSFYVAIYAMLIHRKLTKNHGNVFIGEIEAYIMLHALTHDIEDAVGAEVVRPFKYSSTEFTAAVHKAEKLMVKKLDKNLLSLCDHVEIDKDWYIESVVKAADFMSLYQYMWRERNMGNKEIEPFFQRMQADMKMMQQKLLKEKVEPGFNKYRLALSDLYCAMSDDVFQQDFITS
jgi:5'-deoxynucleotidase